MNELVTRIGKEPKESITSLELLELINKFRIEENKSKLEHYDLLKIIRKEFNTKISQGKISLSNYKTSRGKIYPMYILTLKQSLRLLTKESVEVREKVFDYIEKLEKLFDNVELDEMLESSQILEKANKITQMYILENIPKKLSYIDERILVMSYGLDDKIYSENEIAKSLNIAKHNVNILKEKALNKLSIDLLKNEFMKNSEETDYTVN